VLVSTADSAAVFAVALQNSVPVVEIGVTLKARLVIRNYSETRGASSSGAAGEPQPAAGLSGQETLWIDCPIADLYSPWNTGLEHLLHIPTSVV